MGLSRCALWLLLCLAACGGGEPPPLEPLPPLSPLACSPTGERVAIQLFGDSTQAGSVLGGTAAKTPAVWLQADMDALFGAGAVTIEDRSAPSTYLGQLLAGTDGKNAPWPQSATADIVVVNHGINDASRDLPLDVYRSQLAGLIATSPARVILETPNPIRARAMVLYANAMRDEAAVRGVPVADTWAYVSSLDGGGVGYLTDWAHPSEDLYGHIVRFALVPALIPLVRATLCR